MKIGVGIVSRGTDFSAGLLESLFKMGRDYNYDLVIERSVGSGDLGAVNLFEKFVKSDYDYTFITDTDVHCEPGVVDKLLEVGEDIVVGPVWHYDPSTRDVHLNVHLFPFDTKVDHHRKLRAYHQVEKGIAQVYSSSFACLLMSRKFLNAVVNGGEWLFNDGTFRHVDNIMYQKVGEMGFKVWLRWDIETTHSRKVDLSTQVLTDLVDNSIRSKYFGEGK